MKTRSIWTLLSLLTLVGIPGAQLHAADAPDSLEAGKKALSSLQNFVGGWKGSGSMKGDAAKENFGEETDWVWQFKSGVAALAMTTPKGKYFSAGRITPGKDGHFEFEGTLTDGKSVAKYEGAFVKDELVLKSQDGSPAGAPAQVTYSLVAKGNRMIAYYEKKSAGDKLSPLAEVGFTRKGSDFGKDTSGHECVITGGKGTMAVTYKGQTYYVCCGGCKESFNENPEKELASYAKRKAEEKAAPK